MVRLTDRPDMTLDVYRGRKTTIQHQYWVLTYFLRFTDSAIFVELSRLTLFLETTRAGAMKLESCIHMELRGVKPKSIILTDLVRVIDISHFCRDFAFSSVFQEHAWFLFTIMANRGRYNADTS